MSKLTRSIVRLIFGSSDLPMVRITWPTNTQGSKKKSSDAEVKPSKLVIRESNKAFSAMIGIPETALVNQGIVRLFHEDDQEVVIKSVTTEISSDAPRKRDVRLMRADGTELWVELTVTVVEPHSKLKIKKSFALVAFNDITARKAAEENLLRQARFDELTGLLNRQSLVDRLDTAIQRLWRDSGYVAVIFCDLDGFKQLNDTLGHRAGDEMLTAVAERLRAITTPQHSVARIGGDEFVIVCEDISTPNEAYTLGENIRNAMRSPFQIENRDYGVSVSVGIASSTDPQTTSSDLMRRADLAMYRAKDQGRNRVEFYADELETTAVAKVEATEALRRAIEEDRLEVHYQPFVDAKTRDYRGVEALVRLVDANGNLIQPNEFIETAEQSGLVVQLGESVLEHALVQLGEWGTKYPNFQMGVNVSPRQLSRRDFAPKVFERLIAHGLNPKTLCLEVTESAAVDATGPSLITLRRLRSYGIDVAIDDFGTGYSSLTTLKYLQADFLKIDRSFVQDIETDAEDLAIVNAVVKIAHDLGRKVTAEGVENENQAKILTDLGCDFLQGYLFHKPAPASEIDALFARVHSS